MDSIFLDCLNLNCSKCCSLYYITILPSEARNIAEFLSVSFKQFIKKHTSLYLQLFKVEKRNSRLTVSSQFLPKRIADSFEDKFGTLSEKFLFLPSIALKREGKDCCFLEQGKCRIYQARPAPCSLFPFVSLKKDEVLEFRKIYPFCKALEKGKLYSNKSKSYQWRVEKNFNKIEKQGFKNVWNHLPEKGISCFEDKLICKISKQDFVDSISPFYE